MGRCAALKRFLVFLVPAVDTLGLTTVSNLLGQIINYIPNVFVAVLVLFLGTLAATFVADIVRGATTNRTNIGNPNVYANIARYAILGFVALIALEQLQIAPALLNILFTAIVGAMALALALAFGLGGRESAQRWLARGENTLNNVTITPRYNDGATVSSQYDDATTVTPASQMRSPRQRNGSEQMSRDYNNQ